MGIRQLDALRRALRRLGYEVREQMVPSDDYHEGHLGWQVDCRGADSVVHTFRRVWLNEALEEALRRLTPLDTLTRGSS